MLLQHLFSKSKDFSGALVGILSPVGRRSLVLRQRDINPLFSNLERCFHNMMLIGNSQRNDF